MDWSNENYVRLYTSETADDLLLSWEARALWHEMLKRFDRSGIITARRGAQGLAALVKIPTEVVGRAIAELLEDGRVKATESGWVAPNFMAAQEAVKSDKLRQQESRQRRRTKAILQTVTNGHDESREVTDVTKCHSSSADPNLPLLLGSGSCHEPSQNVTERRRVPEDPSMFMLFAGATYLRTVRVDENGVETEVEP